MFRRLDHHRVADGQARRECAGQQHQWGVPGRDHADHPQRLTQVEVQLIEFVDRNGVALKLVGHACKVGVGIGQGTHLRAHLSQQLAVVPGFQERQCFGVFHEQLGQAPHQFAAVRLGHPPPGRADEGPPRRLNGPINVLGIGFGQLVPGLPRGRVETVDVATLCRSGAVTVNEQIEAIALE